MRKLIILMLLACPVYADISAKIVGIEKVTVLESLAIKVSTEYTYPDGTKKTAFVVYHPDRCNKTNVVGDIKEHMNTILKYYITENRQRYNDAMDDKIDSILSNQATATGTAKIVGTTFTIEGSTDTESGAYFPATGTISSVYK